MKDKIKKLKQLIVNNKSLLKNFGLLYAYYDFCDSILFRKKNNKIGKYYHLKKHEFVKKYIKNNYNNIIEKYKKIDEELEKIKEDSPIFVLWWQGEKNAPEIVKSCINSIKRNAGKHKVIIITEKNYNKYVDMPDYIIEKVNNGKMTITHLSDILRVSLLYKYGGIWMDATLYLTNNLDESMKNYSFYTIHHNLYSDFHVCKGLWMDSFLASGKNNQLMKFMQEIFYEYWKNHEVLICYFLIDCLFATAYENINLFQNEIDKIPANNVDVFELEKKLSQPYSEKFFEKNKNTYIFKTTYRHKFKMKIENNSTFYNELLKGKV